LLPMCWAYNGAPAGDQAASPAAKTSRSIPSRTARLRRRCSPSKRRAAARRWGRRTQACHLLSADPPG
jgi:hypothetical protein